MCLNYHCLNSFQQKHWKRDAWNCDKRPWIVHLRHRCRFWGVFLVGLAEGRRALVAASPAVIAWQRRFRWRFLLHGPASTPAFAQRSGRRAGFTRETGTPRLRRRPAATLGQTFRLVPRPASGFRDRTARRGGRRRRDRPAAHFPLFSRSTARTSASGQQQKKTSVFLRVSYAKIITWNKNESGSFCS